MMGRKVKGRNVEKDVERLISYIEALGATHVQNKSVTAEEPSNQTDVQTLQFNTTILNYR
jgi:hypothetical protein